MDDAKRIAVDPGRADYTAYAEYRILPDGRIKIERTFFVPTNPQSLQDSRK